MGVELVEIDLDLVFLGGAAPGVDLDDPRNGQEPACQHPVLDGAQVGQPEMRRANDLIAIDLADQARGLDLRQHVVRQTDVLLQHQRRLGDGEVVVDAVVERDADEGKPVERGRADDVDAWRGRQADFHRDGVVALHLLGRLAGRLRGDLQDHRGGIWIGLDIQLEERRDAGADEHQQAQENDRTTHQSEYNQSLQHG